ncbi:MAG TPA: porin family protein [Phnomibacter sp.]|nr:porin family protein [Phnomibacter sp.]
MKTLLISFSLLALAMVANGQFLKVGLKAGANMVKIDGMSFSEEYNLGYYGGIFTEFKLGQKWYLGPEILFGETQLTAANEFKDIYENVDISRLSSMKFQRLSIPVTLNYKVANIFSLSAGPQFSIITERGDGLLKNAGKAFTDGDIGMLAGANIMLGKFRINGRYIWGLKNMNNIDDQDTWKAQTAQIGVGFVF